jgi:hypothetical protein
LHENNLVSPGLKPEDLLVFDDTFGVVPVGILEQLQESSSPKELSDRAAANDKKLAQKKSPANMPPVRYSE